MIEALEHRREGGFHVSEIHHPTRVRTGLAADMYFDAERMSMQARALVSGRDIRQAVCGFDLENLEYMHRIIV